MIIKVPELTNFKSNHGRQAEIAIMNAICFTYDLEPGIVTRGNFPDYDFIIQSKTIELKISKKGMTNSLIELGKADGSAGGLSATKADIHLFLNASGEGKGKLRLIPTHQLITYYSKDHKHIITKTVGDKVGSILSPLNFKHFDDLMIGECDYDYKKQEFNTSTFKGNGYARKMIQNYLK